MVLDNGIVAVYESIRNHLVTVDDRLTEQLTQLDILLREKETVLRLYDRRGLRDEMGDRIERINANIDVVKGRLPDIDELLDRNFTCNYRVLYEVIGMEVKNRLLKIQRRIKMDNRGYRLWLVQKEEYMARTFGEDSIQRHEVRDEILRCDDAELKERAVKFKDFLDINNEKATTAFCRLSKEGGLCDDISQIRDDQGNAFTTTTGQGEHIRSFYSELYKKKLDNILSIEGFLSMEGDDIINLEGKKLTVDERDSLEGEVTLEELEKALDSSNFGSSSGWDGISFKVIKKTMGGVERSYAEDDKRNIQGGRTNGIV
jgi:hypothetical protein